MRAPAIACVLLPLLMLPAVAAEQAESRLEITLTPERERFEVSPESRRAHIDIAVKAKGTNFVCPNGAEAAVTLLFDYDPPWAGASPQPEDTRVPIPSGQPGASAEWPAREPLGWHVFWAEDHPRTDASVVYHLWTKTKLDGCTPAPKIQEGHANITAWMADQPAPPTPSCDETVRPDCAATSEPLPPPRAPAWGVAAVAVALAVTLGARARRR